MKKQLFLSFFLLSAYGMAQIPANDSLMLRRIYDFSLTKAECYENLRVLCKQVGARISGSPQAAKAVEWGKKLMERYGFDTVYLQEVMVPHWERGTVEKGFYSVSPRDNKAEGIKGMNAVKITSLGGSVGTGGKLTGEVIEVFSLEELAKMPEEKVKGKIVFFNRPMEPKHIRTFEAYGGCVDQRSTGAVEAAKKGAAGVIIRSVTLAHDDHPHTGAVSYVDSVKKIPAAALSTISADALHEQIQKGNKVTFSLELSAKWLPDERSYNVIGELRGKKDPSQIIAVGGHLDSWDIGEGAHDDGAGCVHSIQVLHTLKSLGYVPNHTIRVVLFMNEENGLRGGKKYAEVAKNSTTTHHLAAIETDAGGFVPRGFRVDGTEDQLRKIQSFRELFAPYQVSEFEKGGSGADIGPLKDGKTCLIGFSPDSQRYFDHHHAEIDVFENVHKRELELGAAAITSLIYLIDSRW